jgi:type VI secretion system protein ImpK
MFGSKGPRSRRPGSTGPAAPAGRPRPTSVTETVVIEAQPRRRAPSATAPSRTAGVTARERLVDLSSDWLSTVLALGHVAELPDPAALRARALELKSRFEREAGERGFTASDTEDAVFAMVAFLDETVLNQRGAARDTWIGRPLQLELYGRQLAGEEFFERLEKLRKDRETRIEALEVYCCCLAFGFSGRMKLAPPERLAELFEQVQRDIAAVRGDGRLPLAPNAARRNERVAEASRGMPWWLPVVVFIPAVVLAFLLVWLLARLGAGHAAGAIRSLGAR